MLDINHQAARALGEDGGLHRSAVRCRGRRGFGEHQARPGTLCSPHTLVRAFCLAVMRADHGHPSLPGAVPTQTRPRWGRALPRGRAPARALGCALVQCSHRRLAGLRPVGVQLGCAHTDSYIKPGILRQ